MKVKDICVGGMDVSDWRGGIGARRTRSSSRDTNRTLRILLRCSAVTVVDMVQEERATHSNEHPAVGNSEP